MKIRTELAIGFFGRHLLARRWLHDQTPKAKAELQRDGLR